ncbi:HD domain-containing protein [Larkinella punicea]|uniref:HD-CE domain-containing protein n=1 Tax=Larkinella punicea TaxID=2315727 RepID=A0A368JMT5_9BACT|nr:ATP-binding protein [Larkinella punicea]RCR67451.1 hypothetical protein DUE52_21865 [Larkinella punicea]
MEISFEDLGFIMELNKRKSPLLKMLFEIYEESSIILNNRIQVVFSTYTLHNTGHSNRIMEYMYNFINDISQLSDLEICVLCYSALLHDIGMAVWDDEILQIKNDNYVSSKGNYSAYSKYYSNETIAIQEFIRDMHAERSANYIKNNLIDKLHLPNQATNNFAHEIALICQSHTENTDWILKNLNNHVVKGDYTFNPQYCACLLRISDILDIDTQRTPYKLYKLIKPKLISDKEWLQHFVISNNKKIEKDQRTKLNKIVFYGSCDNPSIHRKVLTYLDWVQQELYDCILLTSKMDMKYYFLFDYQIENKIEPKGYIFSNHKMILDFKAISKLLMGEHIYGSATLGLRELVQNSIDACKIRFEEEQKKASFQDDAYIPKIKIIFNKKDNIVSIKDNGIGMTINTIKNHFLSIGSSYYTSKDFKLKDFSYQPIGAYGIGFLSCFMLSSTVKVGTRHYLSTEKYIIDLEKDSEYTSISENVDLSFSGTEIELNFSSFMAVFNNDIKNVKSFIEEFFITDNIEFELINFDNSTKDNVINMIAMNQSNAKEYTKIDISKYMEGVEGFVTIEIKDEFIVNYQSIFEGDSYIYDDIIEEFIQIDNDLDLKPYIIDGCIHYLSLPIIDDDTTKDYERALYYYSDDHEKAMEMMRKSIEIVYILLNENQYKEPYSGLYASNDYIFNDLTFDRLGELGHDIYCEIKIDKHKILAHHSSDNSEILEYKKFEKKDGIYYPSFKYKTYLRNVWVSRYSFFSTYLTNLFVIHDFKINILNKKVYANVSRNDLDNEILLLFNYALEKSIYLGVLNECKYSESKKNLLKDFINKFFSEKSILLKN